jgi:hypothetical protein
MAGILTRQQIENEALDNAAKSGALTLQSGTLLSSRITTWVNRAQLMIARRSDLLQATATMSTVANQQTYSFPSNFDSIYTLKLEDGLESRKVTCILPWQFDKEIPLPSSMVSERSWFYVPYKSTGTFELFPIPDDVYTMRLRYSYFPTDFTSSTGVSEYSNLDDAIVAYTTSLIFQWLQELKDASTWRKIGDEIVDITTKKASDEEQFIDWAPIAQGYSASAESSFVGDYVNNPFVTSVNMNGWR